MYAEDHRSVSTIEPDTQPQLEFRPPMLRTKLSSQETVSGNRYDLVLACQPDAMDNYDMYDRIVDLVEDDNDLRIHSPHNDFQNSRDLEDAVTFTVREAIPKTKAVLVHLTTVTPEIQKMFDATHLNNRPFVLFYSHRVNPVNETTAANIRDHPNFKGSLVYYTTDHAIEMLSKQIDELTKS